MEGPGRQPPMEDLDCLPSVAVCIGPVQFLAVGLLGSPLGKLELLVLRVLEGVLAPFLLL